MIGIVDYGLGNIQAFANIYKRQNIEAKIVSTPAELRRAGHIILPGVGSFDWAMARLNESGLRDTLETMVTKEGHPVLGICVGMQMMADSSDEGETNGLGWIPAEVKRFSETHFTHRTHLPHMGWNDVSPTEGAALFSGMDTEARFYFLHSYYFAPQDPEHVLSTTTYGETYASSVRNGNVHGVQFHPEKSHGWGIRLLRNFAEA